MFAWPHAAGKYRRRRTVNAVLNAIVEAGAPDVALGAIGLGSSNDAHKPLSARRTVAGVPVRIDRRAGRTIAAYRPIRLRVGLDGGEPESIDVVTLSALKSVHFAGGMRYDTPVERDDGEFAVNRFGETRKRAMLAVIPRLYRGCFSSHRAAVCGRARTVELEADHPFALEIDGEVHAARAARLEVVSRALRWCA